MDKSEHLGGKYHGMAFSYEKDNEKKLFAYFLLFSSILIFGLTLLGVFDGFSEWVSEFLKANLGYTNKWSKTYGPEWFVGLMRDTSALGGKVLFFFSSLYIVIFYKLKGKKKLLWKFLFVFVSANFILLVLKLIFADNVPYEPIDLLINDVAPFPSGHAMMSLVFYQTMAVFISRRQRRKNVRSFILISSVIIVFIICISRVLVAAHTVSEVAAGYSVGWIWLCLCWLGERFLRLNYKWNI